MNDIQGGHGQVGPVARFLKWWLGELAALVPGPVRRLWATQNDLAVWLDGGEFELVQCVDGESRSLGRYPFAPGSAGPDPARIHRLRDATVRLNLMPGQALRHRVVLPAAARENLRQVLAFEMDRHTPFSAQDVYYDGRVAGAVPEGNKLFVDLAVVPRDVVDRAMGVLQRWGLSPAVVDVPDPAPAAGAPSGCPEPTFNLRPDLGSQTSASLVLINRLLGALAVVLLAAVVVVPLWHQREAVIRLNGMVEEARSQARKVDALHERAERLRADLTYVLEAKNSNLPIVTVLEELTRVVPDQVWFKRLNLEGRELEVHGTAPTASELIGIIEASPMFEDVSFASSVTKDPGTGKEQFRIVTRVSREGET